MFRTQVSGAIMAYLRIEPMNCIIKPVDGKGGLYLGNVYAAQNIDLLTKHNIGSVLTMADLEITYKDFPFINHKLVKCLDIETQDLTPYFHEVADFIEQELTKTNVFVHCFAGVSRSTSAICAYFIKHKGYEFNKALAFIKKRRIVAFPNMGFQRQLRSFEQMYKNTYPNSRKGTTTSYQPPQRSFSTSGKHIDQNRLKNRLLKFQNKNSHWLNENQINTLNNVMKHTQMLKQSPTNNNNNINNEENNNNNINNNTNKGQLNLGKPKLPQKNLLQINMLGANSTNNALMYQNDKKTKQQRLKEIEKNLGLENAFQVSKITSKNNTSNYNNYPGIQQSTRSNANKNFTISGPKKKQMPIIQKPSTSKISTGIQKIY